MRHVYIVPTFACQFSCKSCYGNKYIGQFPGYLSWKNFLNIYSLFGKRAGSFVIAGGEPATWKFLREAIIFLRNQGKQVTVFTNGINYIDVPPDFLMLNGSTLLNRATRADVADNIEQYIRRSVGIKLRFNVDEAWSADDTDVALTYGKTFSVPVSLSLRYPIDKNKLLGTSTYKLAQVLRGAGLRVRMSRCAPPCIFSEAQHDYLVRHCGLKGKCPLPSDTVVVLPDGKSIQPCVELESRFNIRDLESKSPSKLFGDYVARVKAYVPQLCKDCDHFQRDCSSGCLAYIESPEV